MRGRPRKPKTLKVFQGNPSREDLSYLEPNADGEPELPDGLGEFGASHWKLIEPFVKKWFAGRVDSDSLTALCLWWQRFRELERDGDIYKAKAAHGEWLKLAARFGLSPADRARLRTEPTGKQDDLEKFVASR